MKYYNRPKFDARMATIKQDVLAVACGNAYAAWGDSLESFFEKFKLSGVMSDFEENISYCTDGCLGTELVAKIYDRYTNGSVYMKRQSPGIDIQRLPEYWVGWALGHYQEVTGRLFDDILSRIPLQSWLEHYPWWHTMGDRELFDYVEEAYQTAAMPVSTF
jgi:hypothetical protein